jgi:hypothetical protein
MQNLIILGLVPGTHIQINFIMWLYGIVLLGLAINLLFLYRTWTIKSLIVSAFLFWTLTHQRRLTVL